MPENTTAKLFGKSVAARRVKLGLTQEEFASRIGMSTDAVSRMENGRMAPKMSRFQAIAEELGCSVADLFREANRETTDRAATIAATLQLLPGGMQNAMVEFIAQTAKVIRNQKL